MHFVVNNGYAPPQLGFAPPVLSQFLPSTIYILGYIGEKFCAGLGAPQPGIYAIDFRTGDTCRLIALQSEAMLHTTFGLTGQRQLRSTRITIAADRLVYGNKRTIHCLGSRSYQCCFRFYPSSLSYFAHVMHRYQ
jgi:hypothetical protein